MRFAALRPKNRSLSQLSGRLEEVGPSSGKTGRIQLLAWRVTICQDQVIIPRRLAGKRGFGSGVAARVKVKQGAPDLTDGRPRLVDEGRERSGDTFGFTRRGHGHGPGGDSPFPAARAGKRKPRHSLRGVFRFSRTRGEPPAA